MNILTNSWYLQSRTLDMIVHFHVTLTFGTILTDSRKMISLLACLILASLAAGAPSGQAGFLMFFPSATMPCWNVPCIERSKCVGALLIVGLTRSLPFPSAVPAKVPSGALSGQAGILMFSPLTMPCWNVPCIERSQYEGALLIFGLTWSLPFLSAVPAKVPSEVPSGQAGFLMFSPSLTMPCWNVPCIERS